jgi:L-galactose dehydrogenase
VQAAGKARFLGVSGLPLQIFRSVLERTGLDVVLSYCHYCLVDTTLAELVDYLNDKQIGIINASPLSMGLLTESGPPEWHPASEEMKRLCALATQHCRSNGVDISQLALQFSLAQSNFASTLVGIGNLEQLTRNLDSMKMPLDIQLLREVQAILAPIRDQTWLSGRPENN